jgi:hypothetical protein
LACSLTNIALDPTTDITAANGGETPHAGEMRLKGVDC